MAIDSSRARPLLPPGLAPSKTASNPLNRAKNVSTNQASLQSSETGRPQNATFQKLDLRSKAPAVSSPNRPGSAGTTSPAKIKTEVKNEPLSSHQPTATLNANAQQPLSLKSLSALAGMLVSELDQTAPANAQYVQPQETSSAGTEPNAGNASQAKRPALPGSQLNLKI